LLLAAAAAAMRTFGAGDLSDWVFSVFCARQAPSATGDDDVDGRNVACGVPESRREKKRLVRCGEGVTVSTNAAQKFDKTTWQGPGPRYSAARGPTMGLNRL
jgi:hypothetical protein